MDGVCHDNPDASIVRATIELGRQLGLEVVAEGVEDGEPYVTLAGWGCDVARTSTSPDR